MARNVMAAAGVHGALHLFPGNVYNFGSQMPADLTEDLVFSPTSRKGAIRVEMERLFRQEPNPVAARLWCCAQAISSGAPGQAPGSISW